MFVINGPTNCRQNWPAIYKSIEEKDKMRNSIRYVAEMHFVRHGLAFQEVKLLFVSATLFVSPTVEGPVVRGGDHCCGSVA